MVETMQARLRLAQTQTSECGSWRGLARRTAAHKFAQCNNEIDIRTIVGS